MENVFAPPTIRFSGTKTQKYQVEVTWPAVTLTFGNPYNVNAKVSLPLASIPRRVTSFLGLGLGGIVECHADIWDDNNRRLYMRSFHKETNGLYDAWEARVPLVEGMLTSSISINAFCQVTKDLSSALFQVVAVIDLEKPGRITQLLSGW